MKPLSVYQRVLTWIYVCEDENLTKRQKCIRFVCYVVIGVIMLSLLISSLTFFFKFVAINLIDSLIALWEILTIGTMIYNMIVAYYSRNEFNNIFKNLLKIFETCKGDGHKSSCINLTPLNIERFI